MANYGTIAALTAVVLCLSGCGAGFQIREAVGLDKNPPDAFVVMPTRPLEIPQDLSTLPPPSPGSVSPLEVDPQTLARQALGGGPVPLSAAAAPAYGFAPVGAPSGSEQALLSAAGAGQAQPELRAQLQTEAAAQPRYLLDAWFPSLARLRGEAAGDVVEPLAEMRRLGQDAPEAGVRTETATPALLIPPSAIQ